MGKIVEMKIKPEEVMDDLEVQLHNGKGSPDEDYWYDRLNFINSNYEHYMDTYSSTDDDDKDDIYWTDLQTISVLIHQVCRFGRIPIVEYDENSNRFGEVINFPKNEIPKFYGDDGYTKEKHNSIKSHTKDKTK